MPRFICCLRDEPEPNLFVWSTVVDAPLTGLLSVEGLRKQLFFIYEGSLPSNIDERIERARQTGTCAKRETLEQLISWNFCGENGSRLSFKQMVAKIKGIK